MGFSKCRVPVLPIPQTASDTDLNLFRLGHGAPAIALRSTRWDKSLGRTAPWDGASTGMIRAGRHHQRTLLLVTACWIAAS